VLFDPVNSGYVNVGVHRRRAWVGAPCDLDIGPTGILNR
jgi:hypothetical protein